MNMTQRRATLMIAIVFAVFTLSATAQDLTDSAGGSPSASSGPAANGFDNNGSTDWQAADFVSPAWLQWDFGSDNRHVVDGYSIQASESITPARMASHEGFDVDWVDIISWAFEGSHDGSSWSGLDSQTGVEFRAGSTASFSVSNSEGYRYYRFSGISASTGPVGGMMAAAIAPRFAETELFGAPANNPPTITNIPNQVTDEDVPTPAIDFTIGDLDKPADQLGVYGTSQNQSLVTDANVVIDGLYEARSVTLTPEPNAFGSTLISIYVSDGVENAVETFWLTVNPVNDPPVILTDILDQTGMEDVSLSPITFTVDDIDNPLSDLSLSGISNNPSLVPEPNITFTGLESAIRGDISIKDTGTSTVTVTPAPDQHGTATITMTVSDGVDTGTEMFDVTFAPVNDAPVVQGIPDITLNEDVPGTLDLDDYAADVDHADAELTWSVTEQVTSSSLSKNALSVTLATDVTVTIDPGTHVATFTPTANYNGPGGTFVFTATDPGGLADQDTNVVTVDPVNDPPRFLAPLPPITLVQGQFYGFPIVLLYLIVEDPDNADSELIWSVESHPHLNPTFGPDSVKITAPTTWEGTATLTVTISDGQLTDTADLVVTVNKAVDTTSPAPPSGLTAVVGANHVDLSWNLNIEPDISGYVVYRSTDSTNFSAANIIGNTVHPTVSFTDNNITLGVTYYYMVSAVDASFNESTNNPITRGILLTGIDGALQRPTEFSLGQNHPNPFNPTTTISYSLPKQTHVQIAIYNMTGQVIELLVDQVMNTGLHTVQWDAASVPSGIYFYSIRTPEYSQVRKCMLMK